MAQGGIVTGPPYAFSSDAPIILDWWAEWRRSTKAHNDALARIAPEVAPWEGAKPAVTGAFGLYQFTGFDIDGHTVPTDWRVIGRGRWIVPKKSTNEGKRLAARMKEVPDWHDPRYKPGIPGVKLDLLAGAPAFGIYGGVAWMHWGDNWDHLDIVDLTIWSIRRLSEFYAASEADEAAS